MSVNTLIKELKNNNEDFEFYPSTKEMIKTIFYDCFGGGSWLDIQKKKQPRHVMPHP